MKLTLTTRKLTLEPKTKVLRLTVKRAPALSLKVSRSIVVAKEVEVGPIDFSLQYEIAKL